MVPQPTVGATRPMGWRRFLAISLWVALIALCLYFFTAVKTLFLGVLAAGCMAATLHPLMRFVPGPRWAKAVVVALLPMVALGGLIFLTAWLMAGPLAEEYRQWPQTRDAVNAQLAHWGQAVGMKDQLTVGSIAAQAGAMLTGDGGNWLFSTATTAITGLLGALAFVFFGSMFLLGEPPRRLLDPVLNMLPAPRRPQLQQALEDLVPRLRWWALGTMLSMAIVAAASGIGYFIVGVKFAAPLAVMVGLSEIVPTLGPAAAFVVALLFAATQSSGTVIGVAIVYGCVQLLEGYVLMPVVMKRAVKIPPVVTLFSVVLWGQVFGVPGLLLAIPIDLVLWTFADHMLIQPGKAV